VLASVAEFERELIRERTKAGLAAARRRGARLGRRPRLDARTARRARRLAATGRSVRAISRMLDCSRGAVLTALRT
jgi:DNA invertase Pin-like site-specific DNA recombinase